MKINKKGRVYVKSHDGAAVKRARYLHVDELGRLYFIARNGNYKLFQPKPYERLMEPFEDCYADKVKGKNNKVYVRRRVTDGPSVFATVGDLKSRVKPDTHDDLRSTPCPLCGGCLDKDGMGRYD